jgi:hypothetical protein
MKTILIAAFAALLSPALAFAQSVPSVAILESQIIHWNGPEVATLQNDATSLAVQARARPIVMPFESAKAGDCRMRSAVLIIRKDGTGEFDATTSTEAANSAAVWHTVVSIYDNQNRLLFDTGDFESPVMDDARPRTPHRWANRFTADHSTIDKLYSRIDHAQLSYRC